MELGVLYVKIILCEYQLSTRVLACQLCFKIFDISLGIGYCSLCSKRESSGL